MPDADDQQAALDELPRGAAGHAQLHIYAVISRMLAHLGVQHTPLVGGLLGLHLPGFGRPREAEGAQREEDAETIAARFPFLAGYRTALSRFAGSGLTPGEEDIWWDLEIDRWEANSDTHLPLAALEKEGGFRRAQTRLLLAAGLVEEDLRFGALFAALQDPLQARRPCLGLLGWLLAEPGAPPTDWWPHALELIDAGLLAVDNRGEARSEWVLRVPQVVWDAATGRTQRAPLAGLELQFASDFPRPEELILAEPIHAQVRRLPELLGSQRTSAVALRGMSGSGRRTILGSVAREIGRNVLIWTGSAPGDDGWKLLGPLALLLGALPIVRLNPGPGETVELPALTAYRGPVGIVLGRTGGLGGEMASDCLGLALPATDRVARVRAWERAGRPFAAGEQEAVVDRFLFSPGQIQRAAWLAVAYARLDGRVELRSGDVQQAARALNRQGLDTLATPLEPAGGWADIVLSQTVAHELQVLEQRCIERERLRELAGAGVSRTLNRGVRALFSGPSGTGKTLAARALAAELGKDLYRVDLAAVVNKYIGETERNINQVLTRAEELDVVLLLDEGDGLMSNRTDVRNSTDRYANLETNYLLQRLESYEGIILVTTNAGQRIDEAFMRRLDAVIDFAPPDASERWQIWQVHLPANHRVSPTFLQDVASRCSLSGGQIRNAAIQATLASLVDASPVVDAHLEAAVQREFRKAGVAYPLRPSSTRVDQLHRLRQYAAELG